MRKNTLADSEVRTPKDGNKWMIAKAFLQVADFAVVEIYEHLLKTHVRIEPICICIHRHLPPKHPLYMFLKIHCRGLIPTNSYGFPRLTNEQMYMHRLFGMGHIGTLQILNNGYLKMKWKDNDLLVNIKVCKNILCEYLIFCLALRFFNVYRMHLDGLNQHTVCSKLDHRSQI